MNRKTFNPSPFRPESSRKDLLPWIESGVLLGDSGRIEEKRLIVVR